MQRYIDADKLHEHIQKNFFHYDHSISRRFHKLVNDIPTAEVQEVKHGKWEEIRNAYGELEGWLCECGREVKSKENYCPNCGTKMDLEEGDEK